MQNKYLFNASVLSAAAAMPPEFGEFSSKISSFAWIIPIIIGFLAVFAIIAIGVYVYTALAYMSLAKKLNVKDPWMAWIPIANLYLLSKMAGMDWWPILLLIGTAIPFINFICSIILTVFTFIWIWKILEKVGRPGWWVLLNLIPLAGGIAFLVLLGVAAWGKPKTTVA